MMLAPELVPNTATGVAVADRPEGLTAFPEPGCAAAVWHRDLPPGFGDWADKLDPECLPRGRLILRPDAVRPAATRLCAKAGLPASPQRDWLIDDVTALAQRFAGLVSARWLRLRLDVVTTNACRKFHIDAVTARLVCTYRGTGTQYGYAVPGQEPADAVTVATGAPILLKGSLWPANTAQPLLHRSPPIEGTGETRLVLVLDPVDDPEDAV